MTAVQNEQKLLATIGSLSTSFLLSAVLILCFVKCSEEQGEIDAKFMVIVDKTQFEAVPDALTVEEALTRTVESEQIGRFKVARDSLSVGETGKERLYN